MCPSIDATSRGTAVTEERYDTTSGEYTLRLAALEGARWKQLLHVQAPYRWNVLRHLRGRRTIDVGAGIGRTLAVLQEGSVGVDHNADSVALMRARGLSAQSPEEFSRSATTFDGLLCAHVLEHLQPGTQTEMLRPYVERLEPGAAVVIICPQERGFASDETHTDFVDAERIASVLESLGLRLHRKWSFPFPRWAGKAFAYNEFCVAAYKP
jgi:2-polyprenyl-3-methyl-5-hydroxy-6-metoxy-1,4-benzoquinol methylase